MYRHDYALKAMHKHRLKAYHFPMMPITIDLGHVLFNPDTPLHLNFFYREDVVFGTWFKVVVKTTKPGDELYVATFHRVRSEEAARWFRKFGALRDQRIT
jgi:hypothetical protein